MKVAFKNTKTGELKQVKVGWSWTLFFFSTIFGIPLFLRRLYVWGAIMAVLSVLWVVCPIAGVIPDIILWLYLSFKGNEMTAKNYLEHGWVFSEPDSDTASFARAKWGLQAPTKP